MSNIVELSADDILMVSGGGNSGDHDHCWNSVKNDAMHGAIASGYAGLITGGISGIAGGVPGIVGGATAGFVRGAIRGAAVDGIKSYMQNCLKPGGSERGGGWHDTDPGGMAGECRW